MIRKVRKLHNPFIEDPSHNARSGRRFLEWHETVIDTTSDVEEKTEQAEEILHAPFLKPACAVLVIFLLCRLFYLQIAHGADYAALSEGNRTRKLSLLAPRGYIVDRNGKKLAANTASFNLVAIPFDLPKEGLRDTIVALGKALHIDPESIKQSIDSADKRSYAPIVIKSDLSEQDRLLFETTSQEYPGFAILTVPVRDYVSPEIYSHLLGYTSTISEKELAEYGSNIYEPIDVVGKSGVELEYEKFLKGINGREEVEVDARGKLIKIIGDVEPKAGNTVHLSVDKDLQDELYKYFTVRKSGNKGAAIAMNPKTGEVLALVSLPGFDNNLFPRGISDTAYKALLEDKNLPLFNRALSGTYPPGSTVKPMVALAGLEEGLVQENTIVVDKGKLVIPNQYNPSISYNFVGWKLDGLGPVNARKAISESSDIYFYVLAGGHSSSSITPLGITKLSQWYRKFNLGKPTGIDLPSERAGVVADPKWKASYFKGDAVLSKWYLGDTYHVGIGQGDMLVTPLQVAQWTSTIANNGVGLKPRILKDVKDSDGNVIYQTSPTVSVPKVGSDANIAIVQGGMRENVLSGSGRALLSLPISASGKTGTSQFDGSDPKKTHAWFTAYAPAEDPEIVVTVLVEAGGEGHEAAVPIVKQVLQWWAENRYKK